MEEPVDSLVHSLALLRRRRALRRRRPLTRWRPPARGRPSPRGRAGPAGVMDALVARLRLGARTRPGAVVRADDVLDGVGCRAHRALDNVTKLDHGRTGRVRKKGRGPVGLLVGKPGKLAPDVSRAVRVVATDALRAPGGEDRIMDGYSVRGGRRRCWLHDLSLVPRSVVGLCHSNSDGETCEEDYDWPDAVVQISVIDHTYKPV
ncbi:hypothetical protein B0T26DRAFT_295628 [Lasiosphaeria miniovina]|uniref:Uncharacterized protein n=1 Tax=Lasiosphaeria miniovina TaxID=1954250 RepID=A0AA40DVQ4_9PEZI|nr:uncharacterized protein B0T26DRAFT_295628 [Lasiosphaeria miniovina]KAK0717380.1 hypothetical protein B0T26DRAFT_295628 [Lasiosphaeria miniovina]